MSGNGEHKDVKIHVPTAEMELNAKVPKPGDKLKMHLVLVPDRALDEVMSVVKRYELDALIFGEVLYKRLKERE